jgi:hypothetical protein
MRKFTKTLLPAAILVAAVMVAPSLHAQGDQSPSGSMTGHRGMMGDTSTKDDGGMTGDMMGMMKMMKQMSQMMDHCNNMMSDSRPNDQWRKNSPEPDKKG